MIRSWIAVVIVASTGAAHAQPACPPAKRVVFDPGGKRHSLPQLTHDAKGHVVVGYDGPPIELHLTALDAAGKSKGAKLGTGGLAATATDGARIGVVFVASAPAGGQITVTDKFGNKSGADRYQSYFTVVERTGKVIVPRVALGDPNASHGAPGVAIAWNAQGKEWGVLWSEASRVQFARLDDKGKVLGTRELAQQGFVNPHARLVWTGTQYAYVMPTRYGLSLFEFDDKQLRETPIGAASVLEPVAAYANGMFGIAFRTDRELAFVRVKDGKELGRSVVVSVPRAVHGSGQGRGGPAQPTPPQPRLGSMTIAADGAQFVLVWAHNKSGASGFDDRLMAVRLDAGGAFVTGAARRLDDEDKHQGYASIAGTGCDLAVSYVIGDPNGDVRVGIARVP